MIPFAACSGDAIIGPRVDASPTTAALPRADSVADLHAASITDSSVTVTWTQVDDGAGGAASYLLKFSLPPLDWSQATTACESPGDSVGAEASCTVAGLAAESTYDFQVMSYRGQSATPEGAAYSDVVRAETVPAGPADAGVVSDLLVSAVSDSSVTVAWTQVDDGTGSPARYRVKYAAPPILWDSATTACRVVEGTAIDSAASCTVSGLAPSTSIEAQVMAYRMIDGIWVGAVSSNVASATTSDPSPAAAVVGDLSIAGATDSTLTVRWTQIDDGRGEPASYRVKYSVPSISYGSALLGCSRVVGDALGAEASCTIANLDGGTDYEIQLMSYRLENGLWENPQYSNVASGTTSDPPAPAVVGDLSIAGATDSTLTVRWTQVDDGTGRPASYRVKYSVPSIAYGSALTGCATVVGDAIGGEGSCTIANLDGGTDYEIQLMSYRLEDGVWVDAQYSNVAAGRTEDTPVDPGIWISRAEIAALPTSGAAWENLMETASGSCGIVDLADPDQDNNVCVMAKALVYARTGDATYARDVLVAIQEIVNAPTYDGLPLALGRELAAYVIAADVIDLAAYDPALDALFRTELTTLRTTYTSGAAANLIDCHERRPNNWGAHCGATRAAIAVYLGDTADLERTAQVFKGYLGDRSSYAGFDYGGPDDDLSWQCDPSRPVGINPAACTRDGHVLDGALADDQRRAGSYSWPPPKENYVWEALQGDLVQAVILERAGYPAFEWEERALLRAARWLHDQAQFPAEGDDTWQPHVLNHYYGTYFPAPTPARMGKNVGWTDWTHGR
jgi:hypothetical protein